MIEVPALPDGFRFIGDPRSDKVMSPLYFIQDSGLSKFSGYWWHEEDINHAIKRGYAGWIDPGTYVAR